MAERDAPFLVRWSRRKRAGGATPRIAAPRVAPKGEPSSEPEADAPATGEAAPPEPATADAPPAAPAVAEAAAGPVAVEDLPDIEGLGRESDYTPFLRKGVPEHLARRALRKLWLSDPVFANLDGLNDYDEDFAKPFVESAGKAIKTYWTAAQDEARDAARKARAAAEAGDPAPGIEDGRAAAAPSNDPAKDDETPDAPAAAAGADEIDDDGGSRGI